MVGSPYRPNHRGILPVRRRLLVVDDDEPSCRLIKTIFTAEGFDVQTAFDGLSGLEKASRDRPDVVLLDVRLPRLDGLDVLEQLKSRAPASLVIMMTASKDVKTSVRAMHLGAFDYLVKPIEPEEILVVVRRALDARDLQVEVKELRRQITTNEANTLAAQMGPSAPIKQVIDQVETVAASDFSVLIVGETGTGKELVAQAIHRRSDRQRKPFVALDCGAIPEALLESELFGHERGAFTGADRRKAGHFQLAEGGTCLLDEIGNLPTSLQVKLLRVLESKQVQPVGAEQTIPMDVRFVAATNHDLKARIAQGLFRADLYFRVAQYTITLPPLRQRLEDVAFLTQRFLEEVSVELRRPVQQVVPEAMELLRRYEWPGNVRELRNVIGQAVLVTKELVIRPQDLRSLLGTRTAERGASPATPEHSLRQVAEEAARAAEHRAICDALRATRGNKSQAAKRLQTDYKTLHIKMRQLGIHARDFGA